MFIVGIELDLCIYLMSSLDIKMEVEDGTSATCVELISTLIEEDELNMPRQAMDVFCLWMRSPLLEVQLKPHHKPFYIRRYVSKHLFMAFCLAPFQNFLFALF